MPECIKVHCAPATAAEQKEIRRRGRARAERGAHAAHARAREADAREADGREADGREADAREADGREADAREADAHHLPNLDELLLCIVFAFPNASRRTPLSSAASVTAPELPLISARQPMHCLVASVLPAPLSPEISTDLRESRGGDRTDARRQRSDVVSSRQMQRRSHD